MATRQTIRETVTEQLQLGFIAVPCVWVDDDEITVTALRDRIGDTDNRLLEGSFVWVRTSNLAAQAYNSAITLKTPFITTTSQTTFLYDQATQTSVPEIDDIIVVELENMLVTDVDLSTKTLTVIRGVNGTSAATHGSALAVTYLPKWQHRTVSSHSFSTDKITLSRALKGSWTTSISGSLDFYLILSPKELNKCIDEALSELWTRSRDTITLNDTDNRYNLTTTITHLTDPSLLIDMWYRKEDTATSGVREYPVVNRRIEVDDDVLSVTLYDLPSSPSDYSLVVESRKYYSALSTDVAVTTCPLPLIRAVTKVKVLEKIFNKLGASAKVNYGAELMHAREEKAQMYARYKQIITPINFSFDEPYTPPQVPISSVDWRGGWD